ncbi:MAG: extracellular solute-binding protein [Spirochaetia bacterium]|jgi:glucose/mannose transport system substrate-binding protein|nr:extracellular solute-binding protein [Spirochaetia bacterium]
MNKAIIITLGAILIILFIFLFLVLNNPGILLQNRIKSVNYVNHNTLEIFSWWTAGGEAEGLRELYRLYNLSNPGVEIVNATVVGGAGTNAQAVLNTRMEGNSPPDSFQVHAGPDFVETWVKQGLLEPITFLYENNGWIDKFSPDVIERLSYEGEIYAVPLNIHRGNLVWFNTSIFRKYKLTIPETPEEFFSTMEILANYGITPLALGDKNIWPTIRLFENILIARLGGENYKGLWTGTIHWNSEPIKTVLMDLLNMLEYTNSDHSALTWDEAVQYVIDGKCAMISIGDFAEGYFRAEGLTPEEDFGWFTFPGSQGVFSMFSDTFALPKDAEHRENAIQWLELLGSKRGQDVFNPIKGSISPRIDSDIRYYNNYLKLAREDFSSNFIVGSFIQNAEITAKWKKQITEIILKLIIDRDVPRAAQSLQAAANKQINSE